MALNVAGLTAYTEENLIPLMKISVLEGRTINKIAVQPGISSSATINLLNSTLVAQAGACGWNPSGTTALTQRTINVCDLKINEPICLNTLKTYYPQKDMLKGSYGENLPYEETFSLEKAEKLSALVDDLLWKGDTSGSGNLALCDGFLKLFSGISVIDGNPGSLSGLTPANIIAAVDAIVYTQAVDTLNMDNVVLFVGYDTYRLYSAALRTSNLYHNTGAESALSDPYSMYVFGTNVLMYAVKGLNGTNKMVLTPASNLVMGTDLQSDFEEFSIWYSKDNDEVRFLAKWRQGVQVAVPGWISLYENA